MFFENAQAIVLAAGKSTRFKSKTSKLLKKIDGQEIILFSTKLLEKMKMDTTLVVGHKKELIQKIVKKQHGNKISFVEQKEQLGTGHAVACTQYAWEKDHILILNGDVPLITEKIIENLFEKHQKFDSAISFVVSHYPSSDHAYGRVIKNKNGIKIVEAKDFNPKIQKDPFLINAGIYLTKTEFLKNCINKIEKSSSNEFYLTDLVEIASNENLHVETTQAPFDLVRGINTLEEFYITEKIKKTEKTCDFL